MVNLNVSPADLESASKGINGVIDGLGATGTGATYTAGNGRGFGDLELDGRSIGHPAPKSGLEAFTSRWEWGVRALVTAVAGISRVLNLGASKYEREEEFAANAFKDMGNDLVGDPSLTRAQTDKMSAKELFDHNRNKLANPDYTITAEEAQQDRELYKNLWQSVKEDGAQIAEHSVNPVSLATDTVDGFRRDGFTADDPQADQPRADEPRSRDEHPQQGRAGD